MSAHLTIDLHIEILQIVQCELLPTMLRRMRQQAAVWRELYHHAGAASKPFRTESRLFASRSASGDDDDNILIPWVRNVIGGVDLMRHPKYNKGLAFSEGERDRLYLRGLLPPAVLSLKTQMERVMINVRLKASDLERYGYLQSLQERNERLFFSVVREHFEELLPVIHLPTVRTACRKYGLMFKSLPRGLFLTQDDIGNVHQVLKNWPERRVKVVMITDGEQVGPAGDLGVHAVNAAISKLSLISAIGGISPSLTLPILVDFGTNNDELLKSQFYVGLRHRRITGDKADALMHELMDAIERRFGNNVMILFEDMKYQTAQKLLSQYRPRFPCFADDYEGLATAVLAGVLGALPETGIALSEHRVLILGNGPNRASIAEMLSHAIAQDSKQLLQQARDHIFLADSDGLVTTTSAHIDKYGHDDDNGLHEAMLYAKDMPDEQDLTKIMHAVKPTIVISCASSPKAMKRIPEKAVRALCETCTRPLIMALSSPQPELSAAQAYHWSEGRAMYAGFEGPQEEVTTTDGHVLRPSKVQSVYIFPGLSMGTHVSRSTRIRQEQLLAAAKAVAAMVSDEDRMQGRILPPLEKGYQISLRVAQVVAKMAYDLNIASNLPKPVDLRQAIESAVYTPDYKHFS